MPYDEMVVRYEQLYHRLLSDRGIAERIRNKMRYMHSPVYTGGFSARESAGIAWRLLIKGILPGGPRRWLAFASTVPLTRPALAATVVADWIAGLSMADFARRNLDSARRDQRMAERKVERLRAAIARYIETGKVVLGSGAGSVPSLFLSLDGLLDRHFFARAARPLENLLRTTSASVTLRIKQFHPLHAKSLQSLLKRLARYGDRVSIVMDEQSWKVLPVDSSVFNLVLQPR
jgi:hypothetical protein